MLLSLTLGGCIELRLEFDEDDAASDPDLEEPELREGTLTLPTGEAVSMTYAVVDGQAFWSDDVLLGEADALDAGFRSATMVSALWPEATVVYRLDASLSDEQTQTMLGVMDDWTTKTGIGFEPAPAGATGGFVTIRADDDGCYATLGYPGPWGQSTLNIGPGCNSPMVWRHELGHTLGLFHEQARSDRDQFVDIRWDNIEPSKAYAFDKYEARSIPGVDRGPYDYDSIMHYHSDSFARVSGVPTILTKAGARIDRNSQSPISPGDAAAVVAMYGLPTPGQTPDPPQVGSGSCVDACGASDPVEDGAGSACFCDDLCTGLGDCCADFEAACAEDEGAGEDPVEGSCGGRCGDPLPTGDCFCDSVCDEYGDCCDDYAEQCTPASCEGHCGDEESIDGCYCDAVCGLYDDCCDDYAAQCG